MKTPEEMVEAVWKSVELTGLAYEAAFILATWRDEAVEDHEKLLRLNGELMEHVKQLIDERAALVERCVEAAQNWYRFQLPNEVRDGDELAAAIRAAGGTK